VIFAMAVNIQLPVLRALHNSVLHMRRLFGYCLFIYRSGFEQPDEPSTYYATMKFHNDVIESNKLHQQNNLSAEQLCLQAAQVVPHMPPPVSSSAAAFAVTGDHHGRE